MPRENMKITPLIDVAVGIVINAQSEILIAKRQDNKFQGRLWSKKNGRLYLLLRRSSYKIIIAKQL